MSEVASIAAALFRHVPHGKRVLVAIAGAPGSGKATLAALHGEAWTRRQLGGQVEQAHALLAPYGERAWLLQAGARFIAVRGK